MIVLNIYLQGLDEKNFKDGDITQYLREISEKKIPVCLSFVPAREEYSTNPLFDYKIRTLTRNILDNGGILGQQGFLSKCPNEHKYRDPWHENWCWKGAISAEAQREFMEKGRKKLKELTGFFPDLYSPPNHYFDETTLKVAEEMGYRFFADKAMIDIQPYTYGKMLVVPHGELEPTRVRATAAIYTHLDRILESEDSYKKVLAEAVPFSDLRSEESSAFAKKTNEFLKYGYKRARDVKRAVKTLVK